MHYSIRIMLAVIMTAMGCAPALPSSSPEQIIEWMGRPETLAKPESGDVYLSRIPAEYLKTNGGETKLSGCIKAASFLPDPHNQQRFFVVVENALHIVKTGETKSTPLTGLPPTVRIVELGATRTASEGLEVLARVSVEGKNGNFVYALLVKESSIVRANELDLRVATIEEFFALYSVPRCTPDAKQCLKIMKVGFLDKHSRATGAAQNSQPVAPISGAIDATWTPQKDGAVYTLRLCETKSGAEAAPPP